MYGTQKCTKTSSLTTTFAQNITVSNVDTMVSLHAKIHSVILNNIKFNTPFNDNTPQLAM